MCRRHQFHNFPYFDNYFVRTLSGNMQPGTPVTVMNLVSALSRLHRFSSIWIIGELRSTSDAFWSSLMRRPDVTADVVSNKWSLNGVGISNEEIDDMWTQHPDVLKV